MKKQVKTGLTILSLSLFCFLAVASFDDEKQTEESVKKELQNGTAKEVTALKLCQDYEANGVAADENYKDKVLKVSGKVTSIDKDFLDKIYVTLEGVNDFNGVQCYFSDENTSEAASLRKGQEVIILGKGDGKVMHAMMKGCVLVNQ